MGYALLASVALNGILGWAWLDARDAGAVARDQRDTAQSAAKACGDETERLHRLAEQRTREAQAARQKAAQAAALHGKRADAILAAPPAVPGDDCASARARVDNWLQGRMAP